MKKVLFVLSFFILFFAAKAQSKTVPFGDIVKAIETKFNVSISYDADISASFTPAEKQEILNQKSADEALKKLSEGNGLKFKKLRDDFYVISQDGITVSETVDLPVPMQKRVIKGIVYDERGAPLPGAVVKEQGTKNSTMTDLDGKFTLEVSGTAKNLVVTFIGYKDAIVPLTSEDYYEIHMELDEVALKNVVVAGVADKTPEKKLTITVSKVGGDEIQQAPATSAVSALQARIPGIVITQPSGEPGSSAAIRLRGATSMLGRNSPLIIVDGIMVQTSLSDFNVDDIESIEVVKGAAASALYGSQAAGGVIVIHTKRGNKIKSSYEINVRNEFGTTQLVKEFQLATHHPYVLDSNYRQYTYTRYAGVVYDEEGNPISGSRILTDSAYADQPYAIIHDYQKEFFKKGNYFTNYVSLASNEENTNLFLSFENHHNEGIVFHTKGYTRRNFRFNADTKIGKFLKLSTSNLLINSVSDKPGSNSSFYDLLFLNPDVDLTAPNEDGSPYKIYPDPWSIEENPLYPLYYRQRQTSKNTFMTNFTATLNITSWFYIKSKYTFEKFNKFWNTYTPKGYLYGGGASIGGSIYKEQYTSTYQTFQTTANFNRFFGDFLVKAKVSYMYEDKNYYDFAVTGRDFVVPNVPQLDNTDPTRASMSSYEGTIRAIDIFGILDLDYKGKYLFSTLFRRDGSSLFGENERWHNYYRVSGAYRITKDIKIPGFQELKLRAAYGTSGLRPGFSWQYETWSVSNGIVSKQNLGNKDLKPAEARELEIALDAQFLKRFDFYASYSITNTIGAFALAPLASHTGYSYQWRNVGDMKSSAIEASLGIMLFDKKYSSWNIRFNFDRITQMMVNLTIPPYYTGPHSAFYINPGDPFGIIYGYDWVRSLEQMQNQLPEGDDINNYVVNSDGYVIRKGTEGSKYERAILLDIDNDGTPDKVPIGNCNPDFHLSFSNTFSYKGLTVYFLLDWKQGGDIYNYTHQYTFRDGRAIEFDQYGKPEDAKKSIFYYQWFYQNSINSYFVEDGTYLKIRNLSVYYTFRPAKLAKFAKEIKVGIIGRNVYTFTKYTGYDPEVAESGDLTTFAFDEFNYPNFRTITASVQVKF